jgi:hypothetical protein
MPTRSVSALLLALLALATLLLPAREARADTTTCTGFVSTLPRTITAPGHYCLAGNLAWSGTASNAITVAANDVTVDCNGWSITYGGTSPANGIAATNRSDVEIRGCTLVNFHRGLLVAGSADTNQRVFLRGNTVVGARNIGIQAALVNGGLYDNRVIDTVNGPAAIQLTVGATGVGFVQGNQVRGLTGTATWLDGLRLYGAGRAIVQENVISGIGSPTTPVASAVRVVSTVTPFAAQIVENVFYAPAGANNYPVVRNPGSAPSACDNDAFGVWRESTGCY